MEITQIQPQKRNKNRFNLFTEDGFLTSLSYETILKFRIKENDCIEEERLAQAKKEDTVKYAKEQAMQYVAYMPRSRRQVEKKLEQKHIDKQSIQEAMETMKKYGYIDDAAYIREFVRSYGKKLGEQAIRQKLIQNGMDRHLISECLELPEEIQLETATKLIQKQAAKNQRVEPQKAKQRMYAALMRRGFSSEIIRQAMEAEQFGSELEEIE